jgi:hypothetical protein
MDRPLHQAPPEPKKANRYSEWEREHNPHD